MSKCLCVRFVKIRLTVLFLLRQLAEESHKFATTLRTLTSQPESMIARKFLSNLCEKSLFLVFLPVIFVFIRRYWRSRRGRVCVHQQGRNVVWMHFESSSRWDDFGSFFFLCEFAEYLLDRMSETERVECSNERDVEARR